MCKKLFSISIVLMILVMFFSTVSCSNEVNKPNNSGSSTPDTPEEEVVLPCLTFKSPEAFTINVKDNTKNWNGTLQWSTDPTNETSWTEWDGTEINSALNGEKNILCIRGNGNTVITTLSTKGWAITGSNVECKGDIRTLLDFENPEESTMEANCFVGLFRECSALKTAPTLPATTLADNCYQMMFYECTSLTTAPELPATTLADFCYDSMFFHCTSLTTAPALRAETLYNKCYFQMFKGCSALTTVPALPATTLADRCYFEMFRDCSSLNFYNESGEGHTDYIEIGTGNATMPCYNMLKGTAEDFAAVEASDSYLGQTIYTSNQIIR